MSNEDQDNLGSFVPEDKTQEGDEAAEAAKRFLFSGDDDEERGQEEASALEGAEPKKEPLEPTAAQFAALEADVEQPAPSAPPAKKQEAGDDEELAVDEEPEEIYIEKDDGIKRRWYAIHAYSGQEGSVKKSLLVHAEQEGLDALLGNILVPMEKVAEIKQGEKKISKRKFFPGYVLIQLPEHPEKNPQLWHMVKDTPGVSGFIGSRNVPTPLDDAEVKAIIEEVQGERERPRPRVRFEESERVKIIDGPFANFLGTIDEINEERGSLKVLVEIFERQTSVEVEFWQVEKI